jgi:hypothetical protein
MVRNEYPERWAQWLPSAPDALAKDPPDFAAVMPHVPLPEMSRADLRLPPPNLRVSLISSSGAYDPRIHAPFAASSIVGDPSHRVVALDTPADLLRFAHKHFDHKPAKADLGCIIPRESLRGFGVELSSHLITWTGYLLDWPAFIEATVPHIVKQVQVDGGNAAFIVPI